MSAFLLLLCLCTLLSTASAQLITFVSGCSVNSSNRTSQCTPSTPITIRGEAFPSGGKLAITVATSTCASPQYVNSTLLTCRLPAVPAAGVRGEWLNVTATWNKNRRAQFSGVSYAAIDLSSSSSSPSTPPSSSSTGTTSATSIRRTSSSSSSPSSSSAGATASTSIRRASSSSSSSTSSARILPISSTSSPTTSAPTILSVRGCVDSGTATFNCTYTSLLTIRGQNFGSRGATLFFNRNTPTPSTLSANDTTIVCAVSTAQYVPYELVSVRVQTAGGAFSALYYGVTYAVIPPVVTGLSSDGQRGPNVRVLPNTRLTVTGRWFPTSGSVWVALNRTATSSGQPLATESFSATQIVARLPSTLNDVGLDAPVPLSVQTYFAFSAPFMGVTVMSKPDPVSSSTGGGSRPAPAPVIDSISGCEAYGDRTRYCLLLQPIPITISGRQFPANSAITRVSIGSNTPPYALCTDVVQANNVVYATTPAQSFMVNSPYQVWVFWANGANATFYGIYYTDRLPPPTVDSVSGTGCTWNGTAANNCMRGSSALLTIYGQHFPLYLTPNITVGGADCALPRNRTRTSDRRLICAVADSSLPSYTLLPLRVSFPAGSVDSPAYSIVSFRAPNPTPSGSGGGGGGTSGGTALSLEDELIVTLLTVTVVVMAVLGTIFGVTYVRLRRARLQQTSGDGGGGAWNEMVGGDGRGGGRAYRMGDDLQEPIVAAPYMPLVARQMAASGGGDEASVEGVPSPR